MNTSNLRRNGRSLARLGLAIAAFQGRAWGADTPSPTPIARSESIEGHDGTKVVGRLEGDARRGFAFTPAAGGGAIAMERPLVVTFEGPGPDATSATPPFRAELGAGQRISGRLGGVDGEAVRLEDGPGGRPVAIARAGVLALSQRPGEAQVLQDGFEAIDPTRWSIVGDPRAVEAPRQAGGRALRLPSGGSGLTCRLAEPVGSGRLEVAFHDDGRVVAGQRWFVDLTFRGPSGDEWVRALLGWDEESLAVQSSPGGPALAVQRLARKPGWHRLVVRFGPDRTDLSVDGDELAQGTGPPAPCSKCALPASRATGRRAPPGWPGGSMTCAWRGWPSRSAAWRSSPRRTRSG